MKTYEGTVVCKLYRTVVIEVEDNADESDIQSAMVEYFHNNNLNPQDMDNEVLEIKQIA
jgi:hypothetical protein